MTDPRARLEEINLDDLVGAFGWNSHPVRSGLARIVFRAPARAFARQMLAFDALIAEQGLAVAACRTERLYARSIQVYGRDGVPTGPVLFLANHPGVTDTLALLASLNRNDLLAIALERPFLAALPSLAGHLALLTQAPTQRAGVIRTVALHLRHGGAALTFPAGRNELDPDLSSEAAQSLNSWIESAWAFVRLVPGLTVVPVCIRGVSWHRLFRSWFPRLRRSGDDQRLLASALQLLASVVFGIRPVGIRVQFGHALRALREPPWNAERLNGAVREAMRGLIETLPVGPAESIF